MNWKILYALVMGVNLGITFMNLPAGMDSLMPVYGVSYTGFSLIVSATIWTYTVMQLPGGVILDYLGLKRILTVGLWLLAIGNLLPALSPSIPLALAGRIVTGVGAGLSFVAPMKMIALYTPDARVGVFQALFGGLTTFGFVAAYLIIPVLTEFGWQWVYLFAGLVWLPLIAALPFVGLPGQRLIKKPVWQVKTVLGEPVLWILGLYHAGFYGSILTLGIWIPVLLSDAAAPGAAGQIAWSGALLMLVTSLARIVGGAVLLRIEASKLLGFSLFCLSLALAGLMYPGNGIAVPLALGIVGTIFGAISFGAVFEMARDVCEEDNLGGAMGLINFVANLGAGLFVVAFGFIRDELGSFGWGFGLLALLVMLIYLSGQKRLRAFA